ncbi:Testicular acid phosphatase [Araneus ventricosus]|uniref:Testicular acid phosphatase n=1 Tax=Araneus ventricosus TaxID=182803 RepID=A0A4Y2N371_ARAVE|nr:Testicular acid phosphatase [Araneus ventricosus]
MTEESTTLLLVQTIFRHADRAPLMLYPTDPNSEACWPDGMGRLTQTGKKQHYELGKFLRSMYKDFITTNPKEVYVNSSSDDRCLNSAEANLASFYAPEERWKLEDDLNWQPIPIHYLPTQLDKVKFFNSFKILVLFNLLIKKKHFRNYYYQ